MEKYTTWIDNQPLIGGGLIIWYFENEKIKTIIL